MIHFIEISSITSILKHYRDH